MVESGFPLLDLVLRDAVATGRVPAVVAAVTDAKRVLYRGAAGFAQQGIAAAPVSVFRIASMTKLVTTLAVLMLRDERGIDLDAPFKDFWPQFRQPEVLVAFDHASRRYSTRAAVRDITVRQLLTHTSGYGYWFLNAELAALAGPKPEHFNPPFLMWEPGSRFQYGIGTDVLGQMIEPLTGLTLEQFFVQRIFEPLGMRDTGFDVPRDPRRLVALRVDAAAGGYRELPIESVGDGPRGGGGLYSTADDYLALLRLLLDEGRCAGRQLLSRDSVRELGRNQIGPLLAERQTTAAPQRTDDFRFMDGTQKFGLGVLVETRARPSGRAAGSYGWGGIYNTYFWVDPAAGIATVVLMQLSPFARPAAIEPCEAFEGAVYAERWH